MSSVFYRRMERYPPILCRLLARNRPGGRAMTNEELAEKSGLDGATVHFLSSQGSWRGIDVYTLRSFTDACGIGFADAKAIKRADVYIRGRVVGGRRTPPNFRHLRRSPVWNMFYKPLVRHWLEGKR